MTPFERALVAHLLADWLLQNDWMAMHKMSLKHPASWVHALIHGLCLALALNPVAGLVLGLVHLLIDTRVPLDWWMRVIKKCDKAPNREMIAVWTDQVMHIASIAAWIAFLPP